MNDSVARTFAVAILAAYLAPVGAQSAGAQSAGAQARTPATSQARLEVTLGFGGYAAPRRWAPLWIRCGRRVDRLGGAEARIEVIRSGEDGIETAREVFPYREGLRIECPVMVDEGARSLIVRLKAGDDLLAETRIATHARIFPGHIALVCGEKAAAQRAVSSALLPIEPIQAVATDASDLPAQGLDWDAVSALVIRDPGAALAPAQRTAILAWLAAGGRMVVTEARRESEGIVAFLLGAATALDGSGASEKADGAKGGGASGAATAGGDASAKGSGALGAAGAGQRSYAFGLGRIVALEGAAGAGPPDPASVIRDALALEPYGANALAGPSRAFPAVDGTWVKSPDAAQAEKAVTVSLIAWAVAAIVLALNRGRRILPLAIFTILALGAATAGGIFADRVRHRGIAAYAHAFVLPDGGGFWAYAGIKAPLIDKRRDWTSIAAGKSVSIGYEPGDEGSLSPGGEDMPVWRHKGPASFAIRAGSSISLELTGAFGSSVLAGSLAASLSSPRDGATVATKPMGEGASRASSSALPPELPEGTRGTLSFIAAGKEESWWNLDAEGAWASSETFPSWLAGDAAWVFRMREGLPGKGFLVGKESLPAFDFSVHGGTIGEICWVMPFASATREE